MKPSTVEIRIKKIPEGNFRRYTNEEMVQMLIKNHPELVKEMFEKSYFLDSTDGAAEFLTEAFIEEGLDIDTLESDEERKKRLPPNPEMDNKSLWDMLSEEI